MMYSVANGQHFKAGPGMSACKRHIKWQPKTQRQTEREKREEEGELEIVLPLLIACGAATIAQM